MADDKAMQRILDKIIKNAEKGEFELDPLMKRSGNIIEDTYAANNLQERALGKLALEKFKGKIPNKGSNINQIRDFAQELNDQYTPDVKDLLQVDPEMPGQLGEFDPRSGKIRLNPRQSANDFASTTIHEGLHSRDLKNKDYGNMKGDLEPGPSLNKKLKSMAPELVDEAGNILDPKKMRELTKSADINDLKELLLKGHHGIKRGATIAQANLPRLLKGLPILGAAGAMLLSEDASAGVPLLSEADSVGESPEEERQMLAEIEAQKSYDKSPARMNKLKALLNRPK